MPRWKSRSDWEAASAWQPLSPIPPRDTCPRKSSREESESLIEDLRLKNWRIYVIDERRIDELGHPRNSELRIGASTQCRTGCHLSVVCSKLGNASTLE